MYNHLKAYIFVSVSLERSTEGAEFAILHNQVSTEAQSGQTKQQLEIGPLTLIMIFAATVKLLKPLRVGGVSEWRDTESVTICKSHCSMPLNPSHWTTKLFQDYRRTFLLSGGFSLLKNKRIREMMRHRF